MRVAIGQMAPVFLDRARTVEKVARWTEDAAAHGAGLVCFGETLVPAYPVWVERLDGARFNDPVQKRYHAMYLEQAVCIEEGDLDPVRESARRGKIAVVVGAAERARDRGGHSIYCSRVFIDERGEVGSVHRKLVPTHEERMSWAIGDGAGLVTHRVGAFTVGALNCWENWLPTARAALHAQGEDLHVAIWPGSDRLTRDATRFFALEGRSYVVSACGVIRDEDVPRELPERARLSRAGDVMQNGGSCIAGPDGSWVVEPVVGREELIVAEIDMAKVREERHNFDPAGHYGRPDVLRLSIDRRRGAIEER